MREKSRTMVRLVVFVGVLALLGTFSAAPFARADSIDDLKQQIQMLQKKVESLEKQQMETKAAVAAAPAAAPQAPAKKLPPGYFMVPGTNTELRINGYVKLDATWSDVKSADENSDLEMDAFTIPLSSINGKDVNNLQHSHMAFGAKQTRFNIGTHTDTAFGPLTTYVEGDFYGGGGGNQNVTNGYNFRLRHAFGTLGPFLAGQYWSTIMNTAAIPDTIDFAGPTGQLFVRTPQIRWTQPIPEFGNIQFALENPQTVAYDTKGAKGSYDADKLPDFIAKTEFIQPWGQLSLGGVLRQLRYDNGINSTDTMGGFGSFAGIIKTFGKDDVRFQINYGNAMGRYQYTQFADGLYKAAENTIDTINEWGGFVAYRHIWMEGLRSSAVYSYGSADNDAIFANNTLVNKDIQTVHFNLIWSPVPKIDLGLEYIYGKREVESGDDGSLNRIQFGAQYNFF